MLEKGDPDQKEVFTKLREQLQPLADQTGHGDPREAVPAFADGQSALVLDAKSTSESWHVAMPPTEDGIAHAGNRHGQRRERRGAGQSRHSASTSRSRSRSWTSCTNCRAGELKDQFPAGDAGHPIGQATDQGRWRAPRCTTMHCRRKAAWTHSWHPMPGCPAPVSWSRHCCRGSPPACWPIRRCKGKVRWPTTTGRWPAAGQPGLRPVDRGRHTLDRLRHDAPDGLRRHGRPRRKSTMDSTCSSASAASAA